MAAAHNSALVSRYADMFSAIGTEARLRILQLLLSAHPDGLVVGEIGAELQIPNSTLSHHLDKLKGEGLVTVRREGTFLRYAVAALDDPGMRVRPAWVVSTVGLWVLLGGIGYTLMRVSRAQRQGRDELARLFREREALRHSTNPTERWAHPGRTGSPSGAPDARRDPAQPS